MAGQCESGVVRHKTFSLGLAALKTGIGASSWQRAWRPQRQRVPRGGVNLLYLRRHFRERRLLSSVLEGRGNVPAHITLSSLQAVHHSLIKFV